MAWSRIESNLQINGTLKAQSIDFPDETISNNAINAAADIEATKLEHQFKPILSQTGTATTETKVVHLVQGLTGELVDVSAGCVGVCVGDSTITVDVKKNGTTVLSSVISLDSSNTNYVSIPATLSVTSLAVGDVLTVSVTATVGTGTLGTGLFVALNLYEKAQ